MTAAEKRRKELDQRLVEQIKKTKAAKEVPVPVVSVKEKEPEKSTKSVEPEKKSVETDSEGLGNIHVVSEEPVSKENPDPSEPSSEPKKIFGTYKKTSKKK